MSWERFVESLGAWLGERRLLVREARWVIGASGGPDSTILLRAMKALSDREGLGWRLHAAHLHHGLRGADADADAQYVRKLADELGIAAHEERAAISAEAAAQGGSLEELARRRRYEFLERTALRTGSDCVAVAHHADDNAETILHRICRGTGLRGLGGMPDVRPIRPGSSVRLVRPLLGQRRETIERLCAALGIETRLDSSNLTDVFTRGKIRNVILPSLRELINPNVVEALLRLGEQARRLSAYLEDAAARTLDALLVSEASGELVLNTRALLSKQRIIQAEVVRLAVSMVLAREQDLTFGHVESVLNLAADPASGKEVHLPGPVVARKSYDRLIIRPLEEGSPEAPPVLAPVMVACPGRTPLPGLRAELVAEIREYEPGKIEALRREPHPNEEWVDFDRVRPPLFVRPRCDGDRFWPLGAPGVKKLGEFFIDEKVDPVVRPRIGILCDQQGPVWVMPLRIDERVKLRATTERVLWLQYRPAAAADGRTP